MILVFNWKLNPVSLKKAKILANFVDQQAKKIKKAKIKIIICPPFVYLPILKLKNISLGAQDCFFKNQGAFTGEISPKMLKDLKVKYVILGHSERRKYQKEDNYLIGQKTDSALSVGLKPIICIGEELEIRKKGLKTTLKFLTFQIDQILKKIKKNSSLIVAYEPIWAIGKGKSDDPEQSAKIISFIRKHLQGKGFRKIKILYGGSVDSLNIFKFLKFKEIDGFLIGSASLKEKEIKKIIKYLSKIF